MCAREPQFKRTLLSTHTHTHAVRDKQCSHSNFFFLFGFFSFRLICIVWTIFSFERNNSCYSLIFSFHFISILVSSHWAHVEKKKSIKPIWYIFKIKVRRTHNSFSVQKTYTFWWVYLISMEEKKTNYHHQFIYFCCCFVCGCMRVSARARLSFIF